MVQWMMVALASLAAMKLAWNVLTPFELLRRARKGRDGSISLDIFVEFGLLGLLVLLSFANIEGAWFGRPAGVLALGLTATLGSYVGMWGLAVLLGPFFPLETAD